MATYLEYVRVAMQHAKYEAMDEGGWYASIPELSGLWATGSTIEDARKELIETLDGWIDVHFKTGHHHIPPIDGVNIEEPPPRIETHIEYHQT
jgi:predicted RNase H-like HicB family nuclease